MDTKFLKILDKAIAPEPRKRPRGAMNLSQFLAGPAADLIGLEPGSMSLNDFLGAVTEHIADGGSAVGGTNDKAAELKATIASLSADNVRLKAELAAAKAPPAPAPAASVPPPAPVAIDLDKLRSFTARVLGTAAVGDISTLSEIEVSFAREGVRLPFSKREPHKFTGIAGVTARARQKKVDAFFAGQPITAY